MIPNFHVNCPQKHGKNVAKDEVKFITGHYSYCNYYYFYLCDAGFSNVTSVDFSTAVINAMRKKYESSHPTLQWIVSDVRNLKEIPNNMFDVVIDKACLDALVCDEGDPWEPNVRTKTDVDSTLTSVVRILKPESSAFISIGFQQPHFRKRYLQFQGSNYGWEQNIVTSNINVGMGYFYTRCKLNVMNKSSI